MSRLGTTPRLSKSRYLAGLQCHKRLYLEIFAPGLAAEPDAQTRALLAMGSQIGVLARQQFPGGVLVAAGHRQSTQALEHTVSLLADPDVPAIFEAAVTYDQVLVRVDILERVPSEAGGQIRWRLIEVKSSTRVKDVHLDDLAVQAHVLTGAGLTLEGVRLMHINTAYVYQGGNPDLSRLFAAEDVTEAVLARRLDVASRMAEMKAMLAEPQPPAIEPDGHCHVPYECPFWAACTKDKPPRWVFQLPGGEETAASLVARGIQTIDDIPPDFPLSPVQRFVRDQVEWIGPGLKAALDEVRQPVHHLDFETLMLAVPRYPLLRPYQPVPVQWSNHIEATPGEVRHDEFLWTDTTDPREALAVSLLESLGKDGSICVYSTYERFILEGLAQAVPALKKDIMLVVRRLWDLHKVLQAHYYHPAFQGSYSMKTVLPALVPALAYGNLEVQEGGMAARLYYHMAFEETDWVEKARLRKALRDYCARDTVGMLEIRRALHLKVNHGAS
ncbi:MAG: DUF2779 domain-containing protein [Nitrospirales bacterium]